MDIRFQEWSEKKKTIVTAVIGGVIVLAAWSLFAWRYKRLAAAKAECAEQEKIKKEKEKEVAKANKKRLEERQFQISQEYDKKKALIPPEEDVQVFLSQDLIDLIGESSLSREYKIKEGKVTAANISAGRGQITPIQKQEFSLEAIGTYHDALLFLNTIEEHFPRIVNVDRIEMTVNPTLSKGDKTILNLTFKFYIFFEKGGRAIQQKRSSRRRGK